LSPQLASTIKIKKGQKSSCEKAVKKLSCQKIVKKLSKIVKKKGGQKVVKKLSKKWPKSCQKN
jgi:hypothetical protein